MSDSENGGVFAGPVGPEPVAERLAEAECLQLISPGGIGRLAFSSRVGPAVLPVSYRLHEGTIVFRTGQDSPVGEDLRTGIAGADYKVAFEIDHLTIVGPEGWFVFIQGAAHHVDSDAERASVLKPASNHGSLGKGTNLSALSPPS